MFRCTRMLSARVLCAPPALLLRATSMPIARTVTRKLSTVAPAQPTSGNPLSAALRFAQNEPFKTNLLVATLKTALCDLIVQKYVEKKEKIDWKRNAVFWAFGGFYLGGFQWLIYVTLFRRLWPGMSTFANQPLRAKLANAAGMRDLGKQVAFDNFIHYTFIYFPFFYCFKEAIQGDAVEQQERGGVMATGLSKYWENCVTDNMYIWALWIPGDMIVYAVPLWMRLPLNHCISFVWTCYLSFLRGDKIKESQEEGDSPSKLVYKLTASTPALPLRASSEPRH